MLSKTLTKYAIIVVALIISHLSVGLAGWFKRGESEAKATTEAYEKAISEAGEKWKTKLESAVNNAKVNALANAEVKVIETEVIKYVKANPSDAKCYNDSELQLISKAIESANNNR